jgi:hypothetical protein
VDRFDALGCTHEALRTVFTSFLSWSIMVPSGQTRRDGPTARRPDGQDRTGRQGMMDQMDQEAGLTKRLQELGYGQAADERDQRSKERGIDPSLIKVVNWSRKRKRNKGLWKRTRSGGGGNGAVASVDQIRKALGGS